MKPTSLFYLCIMLLTIPFMVACDDDEENTSVSKTEMLAGHNWHGEAVLANGIDVTDNSELRNSMPDIRTLTINFETDGTYTANYQENGAPVVREGDWEFRNNETILYFDLMPDYDFTIATLNEQKLILTTTVTVQGITVPAEVRFMAM